jgi:hypothetical protein
LAVPGATAELWEKLVRPGIVRAEFPAYAFRNSLAEINRLKRRISLLEVQALRKTKEETIKGVRVVENVEANRVQLFFPTIPEEGMRKKLKAHGFRWCKSEGAWQRHLNPNSVHTAKYLLEKY